ncbi:MAG: TraM recognition domain-containing protein, partial [Alphaproteobacteria bacterium]|nr:TraM recognition domain-containing protein [Alphaproteobacteria bacterium]
MGILKGRDPSNPAPHLRVSAAQTRREVRPLSARVADTLRTRPAAVAVVCGSLVSMLVVPAIWFLAPPLAALYLLWLTRQRSNLPFRNPASWHGPDYSEPHPGIDGRFGSSSGILSMGVTGQVGNPAPGEELWISNSDARRHIAVLGTTGSGKALPLEAPVLTPRGWVANGDLRAGDTLIHPDGGFSRVLSVHPQGARPVVRIWFTDGRYTDCSADHLWSVRCEPLPQARAYQAALAEEARRRGLLEDPDADLGALSGAPQGDRVLEARDLGILHGMWADPTSPSQCLRVSVPTPRPTTGPWPGPDLPAAERAGAEGLDRCAVPPELAGTPAQRAAFLERFLEHRTVDLVAGDEVDEIHAVVRALSPADGYALQRLVWSLGGLALKRHDGLPGPEVQFALPSSAGLPERLAGRIPGDRIAIAGVEPLDREVEMSCIRIDRPDGLYVVDGFIPTHNTELLLGLVSQALMWSSGFIFVDGKGTRTFYARVWTLAKRFGREDDVRVLNFMGVEDADRPAGGPTSQTNTMNPFATGSADNLMNLIVSLMGDSGSGGDMWKSRAMSLITSVMKALVEMRDAGEIMLNVQAIRDFVPLGEGFTARELGSLKGKIQSVADVPPAAWESLRTRGGMIELYLRAENGEFSNGARLALKGFFDSLPGFSLHKALNGEGQETKTSEQHAYLSMQLTKPLGGMADDFGHIFNTPLGEIDIEDIVLNRRILVVLLPALQKAEEEMRNCGKIVVANLKMVMAKVSGSTLQGGFAEIIEADQTRAPSPFIVVLDEVGYYMVGGIDVMMAQARSLGFCITLAGQDMAAMQKVSPQVAETALANASTLAVGKTVDGGRTMEYVAKVIGEEEVAVTTGMEARHGLAGQRWRDRQDVSFQKIPRIRVQDLQSLPPGQFYFLFDSRLELARTFFIGENFADEFSINRFLKVRGPMDRVPGLDQSVEERFSRHLEAAIAGLAGDRPAPVIDRDDEAERAVRAMLGVSRPRAMLDALANCRGAEIRRDDSPSPIFNIWFKKSFVISRIRFRVALQVGTCSRSSAVQAWLCSRAHTMVLR